MARQKWNLNTIYISERLKACLRPVTCCALTTVVAPMGYGKTTAINWFLDEQGENRCTVSDPYQCVFGQPGYFLEKCTGGF